MITRIWPILEARDVAALEGKPYRMREYTIRDPNGYLLTFAQPIGSPS